MTPCTCNPKPAQGHLPTCPVASDMDPLTLPEACSVVGPDPIIVKGEMQ